MALEGSMSPNKSCTNNLLDCSSQHEQLLCRLPCEWEKNEQDVRCLEQTLKELRVKCENKDKRISELEKEIAHLKSKLRENKENGELKLLPNEVAPTNTQSVESLIDTIKDLKKVVSLSKDADALQKLIKENDEYKKKLRMQRYSDVPERSQVQIAELQQDLQQLALQCKAMYNRLTNTEKIKSIPLPSMQSSDSLAADNEKLRAKVAEVTEMNKKWQLYNQQRESYMKKLCSSGVVQCRTPEGMKTSQNSTIADVQKESSKLEEENLALKAQIKIFTEDFVSERQDREKAQARVNDLEEELLKMKENQHEKNSTSSELGYSRSLGKYDYSNQQKLFSRLSKHGLVTDGFGETVAPRSPGSPTKKLACPSCMKIFEKQSDLLEHVDICF